MSSDHIVKGRTTFNSSVIFINLLQKLILKENVFFVSVKFNVKPVVYLTKFFVELNELILSF